MPDLAIGQETHTHSTAFALPKHPRPATLCGAAQTFFLLLRFPQGHPWAGLSLVLFACTSCADENSLIPEMLDAELEQAEVPEELVAHCQRNFRVVVFPTSDETTVAGYAPRVAFRAVAYLGSAAIPPDCIGKIHGKPGWLLEDESPKTVAGDPAVFLFELVEGLRFPTVPGAPPQMDLGLDGRPESATCAEYELFLSNHLYAFGGSPERCSVYVLTQVS